MPKTVLSLLKILIQTGCINLILCSPNKLQNKSKRVVFQKNKSRQVACTQKLHLSDVIDRSYVCIINLISTYRKYLQAYTRQHQHNIIDVWVLKFKYLTESYQRKIVNGFIVPKNCIFLFFNIRSGNNYYFYIVMYKIF